MVEQGEPPIPAVLVTTYTKHKQAMKNAWREKEAKSTQKKKIGFLRFEKVCNFS